MEFTYLLVYSRAFGNSTTRIHPTTTTPRYPSFCQSNNSNGHSSCCPSHSCSDDGLVGAIMITWIVKKKKPRNRSRNDYWLFVHYLAYCDGIYNTSIGIQENWFNLAREKSNSNYQNLIGSRTKMSVLFFNNFMLINGFSQYIGTASISAIPWNTQII